MYVWRSSLKQLLIYLPCWYDDRVAGQECICFCSGLSSNARIQNTQPVASQILWILKPS